MYFTESIKFNPYVNKDLQHGLKEDGFDFNSHCVYPMQSIDEIMYYPLCFLELGQTIGKNFNKYTAVIFHNRGVNETIYLIVYSCLNGEIIRYVSDSIPSFNNNYTEFVKFVYSQSQMTINFCHE